MQSRNKHGANPTYRSTATASLQVFIASRKKSLCRLGMLDDISKEDQASKDQPAPRARIENRSLDQPDISSSRKNMYASIAIYRRSIASPLLSKTSISEFSHGGAPDSLGSPYNL